MSRAYPVGLLRPPPADLFRDNSDAFDHDVVDTPTVDCDDSIFDGGLSNNDVIAENTIPAGTHSDITQNTPACEPGTPTPPIDPGLDCDDLSTLQYFLLAMSDTIDSPGFKCFVIKYDGTTTATIDLDDWAEGELNVGLTTIPSPGEVANIIFTEHDKDRSVGDRHAFNWVQFDSTLDGFTEKSVPGFGAGFPTITAGYNTAGLGPFYNGRLPSGDGSWTLETFAVKINIVDSTSLDFDIEFWEMPNDGASPMRWSGTRQTENYSTSYAPIDNSSEVYGGLQKGGRGNKVCYSGNRLFAFEKFQEAGDDDPNAWLLVDLDRSKDFIVRDMSKSTTGAVTGLAGVQDQSDVWHYYLLAEDDYLYYINDSTGVATPIFDTQNDPPLKPNGGFGRFAFWGVDEFGWWYMNIDRSSPYEHKIYTYNHGSTLDLCQTITWDKDRNVEDNTSQEVYWQMWRNVPGYTTWTQT